MGYLEGSGRDKTDENESIVSLGTEIEPIQGLENHFFL